MTERRITVENAYTQQNYLIQLCMGYTDRLNELEAKYRKMQAENWHHRAKQLKSANAQLHREIKGALRTIDTLTLRLDGYRATIRGLKQENRRLQDKLARYQELERVLNGGN